MKTIIRTIKVCLSCTPSHFMDTFEKMECFKVRVSFGGVTETHYVIRINKDIDNGFSVFDLIDGRTIIINPRYILSVEKGTCAIVYTDITNHKNFHTKVCEKCIESRYYFIQTNEDIELSEKYDFNDEYVLRQYKTE